MSERATNVVVADPLHAVAAFLNEIGLRTVEVEGVSGMLPSVRICQGELRFDRGAHSSDLLHDAGHLAIVPARFRSMLDGNTSKGIRRMFEIAHAEEWEPDCPEMRALMQTGDTEATAWAWAAGQHLGLAPEDIINTRDPDAYNGDAAGVIMMMQMRAYLGIHGLQHAGFCRAKDWGASSILPVYPKLAFWLQK